MENLRVFDKDGKELNVRNLVCSFLLKEVKKYEKVKNPFGYGAEDIVFSVEQNKAGERIYLTVIRVDDNGYDGLSHNEIAEL